MPYLYVVVSFGLCLIAYALLALMLRPLRRVCGAHEKRLQIASLATCVWAIAAVGIARTGLSSPLVVYLAGNLLLAVWLWQLEPLSKAQLQPVWFLQLLKWAGPSVCIVSILTVLVTMTLTLPPAADHLLKHILVVAGLLLASVGLLALEQTYRNATVAALPAIRWLCLGLGGIFVAQLVMFAEALLLGEVGLETWVARGVVNALCTLAIGRGARLMPNWSVGLFVSRQVVFYTTSFVVIGGYLLLMSLGGWALANVGGQWGRLAQAVFSVGGVLLLSVMLFSSSLRRRVMVFISTHFFRNRYDYRIEWLRFIRTLSDSDPHASVPQKAIRAVTQIIESPKGVLWTLDVSQRHYERRAIWPQQSEALLDERVETTNSLATFLARTGWLIDVVELARKPAMYEGLRFEGIPAGIPRDALIVPLLHVEQLYGWLVLERPDDLRELTFEDRDLLKIACRQIAAHLSQLDSDLRLAEARQFEAYNRMTAFVMHDLKNLAAQLGLIVQNAERHKRNPEFVDDAMKTIGMSVERMSKLIAQLTTGETADAPQAVDLATVVERVALRCGGRSPVPRLVVRERAMVYADLERLGSILEHAVRNAQDATPATGDIMIEVGRDNAHPQVRIVDNGSGMDEAFVRERLFRPFDTTKGARGMGIGAYQIREYMRSLGGDVEVTSSPGSGTRLTLVFPFAEAIATSRMAG